MTFRSVLVTGATGYIGQSLVQRLLKLNTMQVRILSRDKTRAQKILKSNQLTYYDQAECLRGTIPLGQNDILLHAGFARPYVGNTEIAKSLEFTGSLFTLAAQSQIPAIINISSRSVYGQGTDPPWNEETPINPQTVYGQAKYASELLLRMAQQISPHTSMTSIRLGTVSGGANGLVDVFFLSRFVLQALNGEPLRIIGGSQEFDILDIQDTVDALSRLLETPAKQWDFVYNLSSSVTYNIQYLAQRCVDLVAEYNGRNRVKIQLERREVDLRYGLDCQRFYIDMNWKPNRHIDDTIRSLIEFYIQRNEPYEFGQRL